MSLLFVLFTLTMSMCSQPLFAQDPCSNSDLVKMARAHLSTKVIVEQVRDTPGNYCVTANSLIALERLGVPDEVIAAVQEKMRSARASQASPKGAPNEVGGEPQTSHAAKSYSVAAFSQLLQSALRKAATARGMSVDAYDKERAFIENAVKTCSQVTPTMAVDPRDKYLGHGVQKRDVERLQSEGGPQFAVCQGQDTAQYLHIQEFGDISLAAGSPHGVAGERFASDGDVLMRIGQKANHNWSDGDGFYVSIRILARDKPDKYDEVLSDIHIKGQPDDSVVSTFGDRAACAASGEIPPKRMTKDDILVKTPSPAYPPPGVSEFHLLEWVEAIKPKYDNYARQIKRGDNVPSLITVQAVLGTDGQPCSLRIGEMFPDVDGFETQWSIPLERAIDEAVLDAVAQWKFRPQTMFDGRPTPVRTFIQVPYPIKPKDDPQNPGRSVGSAPAKAEPDQRTANAPGGEQKTANELALAQQACAQEQAKVEKKQAEDAALGWWRDPAQPLMWTLKDNGADLRWKQAEKYCSELRLGGFADWRLATLQELKAMFDPSSNRTTAAISRDGSVYHAGRLIESWPKGSVWTYHIRGNIGLSALEVWSATDRAVDRAWPVNAFDFSRNMAFRDNSTMGDVHRALCVRSYSPPPDATVSCSAAAPQTATK